MQPEDKLRLIRHSLGASYRDMADLVGLSGTNANDRLVEMEEGRRPVSGPIERTLEYLSQGVELGAGDFGNAILCRLPGFVELQVPGEGLTGVLHTRYPRFVAVFSELMPAAMRERLEGSDLEQLEMPASSGLGKMVAVPLDRHHGSLKPLIEQAADFLGLSST